MNKTVKIILVSVWALIGVAITVILCKDSVEGVACISLYLLVSTMLYAIGYRLKCMYDDKRNPWL